LPALIRSFRVQRAFASLAQQDESRAC
jgi:hypothetical protein